MKCRLATKQDLAVLKKIWDQAFLKHESQKSIDFYFANHFDLKHTFVLENDKQEIVCTLQLNQHELMLNKQPVPVSFVVGAATVPQEQRKGYMRQLLNHAIEYARDTLHQDIMILQAYNWAVYRSFGFFEAYYKRALTYSIDELNEYPEVPLETISDKLLLKIYEAYTKDLNGYKIRDEKYFAQNQRSLAVDEQSIACSAEAYLFYQIEDETMHVMETAFNDKTALLKLLKTVMADHNVKKAHVSTDIKNFKGKKTLFMMVKNLSGKKLVVDDRWYISEWI